MFEATLGKRQENIGKTARFSIKHQSVCSLPLMNFRRILTEMWHGK